MAYDGWITTVDSLFSSDLQQYLSSGEKNMPRPELTVDARDLKLRSSGLWISSVVFDTEDMSDAEELKCVVFARDKSQTSREGRKHYVLVIAPHVSADG